MNQRIFIFLFLLLLLLPLLGLWSKWDDQWVKSTELRKLTPFPSDSTSKWNRQFFLWHSDHFGFRNALVRLNSTIRLQGLNSSPLPYKFITGKNGYQFREAPYMYEAFDLTKLYTPVQLQQLTDNLKAQWEWCTSRGIELYILIPPAKFRICQEHLPAPMHNEQLYAKLDQLRDHLQDEAPLPIVEVAPFFPKTGNLCDMYLVQDPHWNDLGAFWGVVSLLEKIKIRHAQLPIPVYENYVRDTFLFASQFIRMANLRGKEPYIKLEPKGPVHATKMTPQWPFPPHNRFPQDAYEQRFHNDSAANDLKVMLIHDSFCVRMLPFFNEIFRESVYTFRDEIADWWDKELIMREKPDILVLELLELKLDILLSETFSAAKKQDITHGK